MTGGPYTVELTGRAAREFASLPAPVRKRVGRWLDLLGEDPRRPGTKQLAGAGNLRRVHVGRDHVIVYAVREERVLVLVVRVAHRKEAYRRLPRDCG